MECKHMVIALPGLLVSLECLANASLRFSCENNDWNTPVRI